jgi:N-acylneuraminate cytidylyltransferase
VAIIPARSGSKRIKGKNSKNFLGMPLIEHPIKNLISSSLFSQILVSTDSYEIADLSRALGAQVPFMRDASLSDDFTSTLAVMQNALQQIDSTFAADDIIFCAYPGAVLSIDTWRSFVKQAESIKDEFLVTVGRMRTNPQRLIKRASAEGFMEMVQPSNAGVRTQDLEEYFYDAGKVYAATASTWLSAAGILSSTFRAYELPYWEAQDLDEPVDWEIAELMLRGRI